MNKDLLLAIPTNPTILSTIYNDSQEFITKVTLISVDFPPIEIFNGNNINNHKNNPKIFNQKNDQAVMFDVVGLIIDITATNVEDNNDLSNNDNPNKKIYIIANEVMYITNANKKLISINGHFDILSNELMSNVYANFSKLKSIDLSELEDVLQVSKDESSVKAFNKLGSFFTATKYETNNNIFNLIEHQEKAELVAKKVLIKKMVAWEIRK